MRFSAFVENVLRNSGWFPDRNIGEIVDEWESELEKTSGWKMFPAAKEILQEFGEIKVNLRGAGETSAREPFEIFPKRAMYEDDRFAEYEEELNTKLYPLGLATGSHYFIAVAEDKRVFLLMDNLIFLGEAFDEALENLILGRSAVNRNKHENV